MKQIEKENKRGTPLKVDVAICDNVPRNADIVEQHNVDNFVDSIVNFGNSGEDEMYGDARWDDGKQPEATEYKPKNHRRPIGCATAVKKTTPSSSGTTCQISPR
ncbi:unnamed protein product [Urochloa humidicola]